MHRWANRRTTVAVSVTGALALACAVLIDRPHAQQAQAPPSRPQPQPPDQAPPPTFRLGANYVRVDMYPTRNGEPVTDLERGDVELLEDGVPQKIEQFERISIQTTLDRSFRRDPNTVAESREQAADPRRRVFVVFLDTGMTTVEASFAARKPIVEMLDRLIGDDDLFAVMTPDIPASGIAFARRTESIEAELAKYWTWGQRDQLIRSDPEEAELEVCYPDPAPERICTGPRGQKIVQPANAYRGVAAQLIERRNEQRAIGSLDELVTFLGAVREERKAVIVVSQGWRLLEPKPALTKLQECDEPPMPGVPGTGPTGRIVPDRGVARAGAMGGSAERCSALTNQYAFADNASDFRKLIERANRFNVSFYPFDTRGLGVFDRTLAVKSDRIRGDPGERSENLRGTRGPLTTDMDRLTNRVTSLQTLAEATDGLAVVNTNDLAGGARRIANDLSTYYLIGYQSTNTALDGKWREITVKARTPGVRVRARRGYRALTEAELSQFRRGETTPDAGLPAGGGAAAAASSLQARLVGELAGLERPLPWRSRAAWNSSASGARVWIASDVADTTLKDAEWAGGGTLTVTLATADGRRLGETTARLDPGARALEASLEAPVPPSTDVMVRLRLTPASGGLALSDTLRFAPSGASARLFRRGPTTGRQFVPVGEPRFRRSEYARVMLPVADASAVVEATLLDRAGAVLRVPAAARVETIEGTAWAIGEASLASLAPGDYVLRLATGGSITLTAFRIVN